MKSLNEPLRSHLTARKRSFRFPVRRVRRPPLQTAAFELDRLPGKRPGLGRTADANESVEQTRWRLEQLIDASDDGLKISRAVHVALR